MINAQPAGLLSLLGLKSGLDAPKVLDDVLRLGIDVLPFYIASILRIDESGSGFSGANNNLQLYPQLLAVPQGQIRYIERASCNLSWISGPAVYLSGWLITRSSGSTYPLSAITYNPASATTGTNFAYAPYSRIKNFIMQPGDRLGVWVSSDVLSLGQVNFGIRYADFVL